MKETGSRSNSILQKKQKFNLSFNKFILIDKRYDDLDITAPAGVCGLSASEKIVNLCGAQKMLRLKALGACRENVFLHIFTTVS